MSKQGSGMLTGTTICFAGAFAEEQYDKTDQDEPGSINRWFSFVFFSDHGSDSTRIYKGG